MLTAKAVSTEAIEAIQDIPESSIALLNASARPPQVPRICSDSVWSTTPVGFMIHTHSMVGPHVWKMGCMNALGLIPIKSKRIALAFGSTEIRLLHPSRCRSFGTIGNRTGCGGIGPVTDPGLRNLNDSLGLSAWVELKSRRQWGHRPTAHG